MKRRAIADPYQGLLLPLDLTPRPPVRQTPAPSGPVEPLRAPARASEALAPTPTPVERPARTPAPVERPVAPRLPVVDPMAVVVVEVPPRAWQAVDPQQRERLLAQRPMRVVVRDDGGLVLGPVVGSSLARLAPWILTRVPVGELVVTDAADAWWVARRLGKPAREAVGALHDVDVDLVPARVDLAAVSAALDHDQADVWTPGGWRSIPARPAPPAPPKPGPPSEWKVPVENLRALQSRMDVLRRSAARLKQEPPTLELVGDPFVEERNVTTLVKTEDGVRDRQERVPVRFQRVRLVGAWPGLTGWAVIGTVEPLEGGNILHPTVGESLSERYRHVANFCDQCRTTRRRTALWIVRNRATGEERQLGGECLRDYIGHASPEVMGSYAEALLRFADETAQLESEVGASSGEPLGRFLEYAAAVVLREGFVSAKMAEQRGGRTTAEGTRIYKREAKEGRAPRPNHAAVTLARETLAWAQDLPENAADYLGNVRALALRGAVFDGRDEAIAASMIAAYQRASAEQRTREAVAAGSGERDTLGAKGDAVRAVVRVIDVRVYPGKWGDRELVTTRDGITGAIVKFWSTFRVDNPVRWRVGHVYGLAGTVKDTSLEAARDTGVQEPVTTLERVSQILAVPQVGTLSAWDVDRAQYDASPFVRGTRLLSRAHEASARGDAGADALWSEAWELLEQTEAEVSDGTQQGGFPDHREVFAELLRAGFAVPAARLQEYPDLSAVKPLKGKRAGAARRDVVGVSTADAIAYSSVVAKLHAAIEALNAQRGRPWIVSQERVPMDGQFFGAVVITPRDREGGGPQRGDLRALVGVPDPSRRGGPQLLFQHRNRAGEWSMGYTRELHGANLGMVALMTAPWAQSEPRVDVAIEAIDYARPGGPTLAELRGAGARLWAAAEVVNGEIENDPAAFGLRPFHEGSSYEWEVVLDDQGGVVLTPASIRYQRPMPPPARFSQTINGRAGLRVDPDSRELAIVAADGGGDQVKRLRWAPIPGTPRIAFPSSYAGWYEAVRTFVRETHPELETSDMRRRYDDE